MLPELTFEFNILTLLDETELMQIDIVPQNALVAYDLPPDQQPALTYLAGLAPSSQRVMWAALSLVCAVLTKGECSPVSLPWHLLHRQHVNGMRAWLAQNRAPATGNRVLAALRGTLKEAWRLGQMNIEEYNKAIDVKPIKGERPAQAAGRSLTSGEISALLNVCADDLSYAGVRDAAILGLAIRCGLRRAEIAGLQHKDYDPEQQMLWVHGKGNKIRTVPVAPGVDDALADWLHVRGNADGALFHHINKGGTLQPGGISDAAVYDVIAKRARQAKIKRFSPHDGRRTYVGDLLDAGVDIVIAQKLVGHANTNTTAGYDRRGERAKVQAANRLHLPWSRRY